MFYLKYENIISKMVEKLPVLQLVHLGFGCIAVESIIFAKYSFKYKKHDTLDGRKDTPAGTSWIWRRCRGM
jgi:hypothetical protein